MSTPRVVSAYVACLVFVAAGATAMLASYGPPASLQGAWIAAFLCAIGWLARRLTFEGVIEGADGRVYYFVFPAAAIAVANWTVPVGVALTTFAIERARGAAPHKAVFNTAAPMLASSVSILVYQAVGGLPWIVDPAINAIAVLCLLITNHLVSDASLVGVLSLSQTRPIGSIWRAVAGRNLADDILVAPVVGLLAYAVVIWGFVATFVISATLVWVHKLYQTNRALGRLSSELLELMVTAIEARDPYTSGHSRRVSRLAMEIARSIGLPERDIKRIGVAGLLHDVGKIHEKYATILQKPDRLTKDEWLLMKEHPADGEALIAKVSELHDILPAVRHHHERWDGAGYPDGLRGEAIPLMARVLTFADTIDAMTSTRPYRRGLTQDEVRVEILNCAGRQFDPRIAEALLASRAWTTLIEPVDGEGARYGLRLLSEAAQSS